MCLFVLQTGSMPTPRAEEESTGNDVDDNDDDEIYAPPVLDDGGRCDLALADKYVAQQLSDYPRVNDMIFHTANAP